MIIALDYDGTYTKDADLWNSFISDARAKGHEVLVVTMRHSEGEGEEVRRHSQDKVDWIHFTGRKAKREYLSAMQIFPHIWIDDQPDFILYGA